MKSILSSTIRLSLIACFLASIMSCQQTAVSQRVRTVPRPAPKDEKKESSRATAKTGYAPPSRLGLLEYKEINESSGIVASRATPGMYWTHNDSGDGPFLYAFDARGAHRGVWRVTGATARDWEDIAAGPGPDQGKQYLYIGDIGDNTGTRREVTVYRVPEPTITATAAARKTNPISTTDLETIRLRYPDGKHNAEALLVHPSSGTIYIVTKVPFGNSVVYRAEAPLGTGPTTTMVRVAELEVPGFLGGVITGGDISPDGLSVALCDYGQGYEIVLPQRASFFEDIWKQPLIPIALGERNQGEAIGYRLDGKALLATGEGRPAPLIQVTRR